jgi:hypothetical protein
MDVKTCIATKWISVYVQLKNAKSPNIGTTNIKLQVTSTDSSNRTWKLKTNENKKREKNEWQKIGSFQRGKNDNTLFLITKSNK